jgi:hypothetical protein
VGKEGGDDTEWLSLMIIRLMAYGDDAYYLSFKPLCMFDATMASSQQG